ncbi:MAG: PKD domain-containing protein, partial [Candidatus Latescibacteria bacterium]|nr:PKD domain-containing protein [Candidatus Latescibacterota bacterium]
AAFTADVTSGQAPLTVQFTDQSTGDVMEWEWNFGDGSSSTEQNPLHLYETWSTFTVSLEVRGPGGTDTKTNYITVLPPDTIPVNAPFDISQYFYPSGWMGDVDSIEFDDAYSSDIRTGDSDGKYIKIDYAFGTNGWAGIYWQHPENNWGDTTGVKIIGATKVTFWARGQTGGEKVQFKAGGIDNASKKYKDSFSADLGYITFSDQWTFYEIDLSSYDLLNVIGGFMWVSNSGNNPGESDITFYLDEIRYE